MTVRVLPIPPSHPGLGEELIKDSPIRKNDFGDRSPVFVHLMRDHPDGLPEGEFRGKVPSLPAECLILLWCIDAFQSYAFANAIMRDSEDVAIIHADDFA